MIKPLVSVIVPIYNAEKYLAETIESIINQTYYNLEVLLINHNSTDESISIIKHYKKTDNRIKVINLDINKGGPAYPRNEGLKVAKGKYVAFLDADDVWLPQKLEKQVAFLEKNPEIDICHTLANIIDEKSVIEGFFDNQKLYNKLKLFLSQENILFYTNNININSTLMRLDKTLKFEEDKHLVALEDWNYWIEHQKIGKKIVLVDVILLNYRIHQDSISNRKSDKGYRKTIYMLSKIFLNGDIQMRHFFFSLLLELLKIIRKNYR